MGAVEFQTALTTLEGLLAGPVTDPDAVRDCLRTLSDKRPDHISAVDLKRLFAVCYDIGGLGLRGIRDEIPDEAHRRMAWTTVELIEGTFFDPNGRNRAWSKNSDAHHIAFNRPARDHGPRLDMPLPHIPLELEAARTLAQPYLQAFEEGMDAAPYAHLDLCWKVADHPTAPFDVIFADWIEDIDARSLGVGGTATALRRARALCELVRGRQRVTRASMDTLMMPQLSDPHPMVAASAARFIGMVYSDTEELFNHGEPEPLPNILTRIATLETNRRPVAGGMLHGLDVELSEPFSQLKADPRLEGFDIDGWVMDVFADNTPEVYMPGAQAFWFYVHEGYCNDPTFITRLIDAGHPWEAMMCATELHHAVDGMKPVLERLAAMEHKGVSEPATRCLQFHYTPEASA